MENGQETESLPPAPEGNTMEEEPGRGREVYQVIRGTVGRDPDTGERALLQPGEKPLPLRKLVNLLDFYQGFHVELTIYEES